MKKVAKCPHCSVIIEATVGVRSQCPRCFGYLRIRPSQSSRSHNKERVGASPRYPQNPSWEVFDEENEYQVIVYFPHHDDHEVKATVVDGVLIIESLRHNVPSSFYHELMLPEQVLPSSLRRVLNNGTLFFRFGKKEVDKPLLASYIESIISR